MKLAVAMPNVTQAIDRHHHRHYLGARIRWSGADTRLAMTMVTMVTMNYRRIPFCHPIILPSGGALTVALRCSTTDPGSIARNMVARPGQASRS
jgi:hypothetical protein